MSLFSVWTYKKDKEGKNIAGTTNNFLVVADDVEKAIAKLHSHDAELSISSIAERGVELIY